MSCLIKPKRTFSIGVGGRIVRFDVSHYYNLTVEKGIYKIDVNEQTLSFSEDVFNDAFEYTM